MSQRSDRTKARPSTGIAFDGLPVTKLCAFRIKTGCPPCLPLAEQIPATIQHDLNVLETLAVGIGGRAVRFPLEYFVLLARKLVNVSVTFLSSMELPYVCSSPGANNLSPLPGPVHRHAEPGH
jgi:hypothetical protein